MHTANICWGPKVQNSKWQGLNILILRLNCLDQRWRDKVHSESDVWGQHAPEQSGPHVSEQREAGGGHRGPTPHQGVLEAARAVQEESWGQAQQEGIGGGEGMAESQGSSPWWVGEGCPTEGPARVWTSLKGGKIKKIPKNFPLWSSHSGAAETSN